MDYVTKEDCKDNTKEIKADIKNLYQISSQLNTRLARIEGRIAVSALIGAAGGSTLSGIIVGIVMFLVNK